jgi:hypothetical protein
MAVTWIVHKETDLLNGMGEIRSGEGEVLESSSQAAVFGRIRDAGAVSAGKFGFGVEWGSNGVAVQHVGALQQFERILLLREEETGGGPMHIDPQEMVYVPEIRHVKLAVKRLNDVVKSGGGAGGKYDVIDIQQ